MANERFIQINPSTEGFLTNKLKNDKKIMEINSHKSSHCNLLQFSSVVSEDI